MASGASASLIVMSFRNVLSLQCGMDILLRNEVSPIRWPTPPRQEEGLVSCRQSHVTDGSQLE